MTARVQKLREKLGSLSRSLMLGSILVFPRFRLAKQEADERIVLVVRKHPVVLLWRIVLAVLELLLGFFIIYILTSGVLGVFGHISKTISLSLYLINLMFFVTTLWTSYLTWYYDLVIVTTTRIVDMDFKNILAMRWTEARLAKIEDVTIGAAGLLSALFDMGNLFLQTAGSRDEFEIRNIPRPLKVQSIIMELVSSLRRR